MSMTLRERILAVYHGHAPDVVPYMLDLSHWFYHKHRMPWDLSIAYVDPERELIDYHRQMGVGFYMPNLAAFFSVVYPAKVAATTTRQYRRGDLEIVWRFETPEGAIERARVWEDRTYSWAISRWGIRTEADLRVFRSAMCGRRYVPHWDRYQRWDEYVGDVGVVYLPLGYSAVGHLMHYWMGVEGLLYATTDWPDLLHETVDAVNENQLSLVDLACESPANIVILGDNFSGDVQPPSFFARWSQRFYEEAIARLHRAGKFVAVHIDGRLKGALSMIRQCGADCADAVTPKPMGDLTPEQCRAEAGGQFILSGGVSPDLWLPNVPPSTFEANVRQWLDQSRTTFRLFAGAGDQVPPGAGEDRIVLMRDLVEQYGRVAARDLSP
ncbi:MAG TPA: uroporphyrinogen decarboxylase family protein [Sedimentisphaerales bacterium]|nr:uroporphyrinogen decarboxylase family protein [Sedimentisphaerales bacterium]